MYIVAIAWMYVALMMAVAEATNTNGTVLGAIVTLILYGLLPVALVVYLMRSPGRKRAIKEKETLEAELLQPNAPSHAPAAAELDSITPVREKS
jgi:mannose/fructose/N-acetylgalactosamine-specific phosphotransferase system component IID